MTVAALALALLVSSLVTRHRQRQVVREAERLLT